MSENLYMGTSGFNYKDWREIFYPKGLAQKKWLAFYAQHYNSVEINATFYRYFPRSVFARWHAETQADFRFVLKGPRVITHVKRLHQVNEELDRFFDSIQGLSNKLCAVLWQFPSSFKYSEETLRIFSEFLQRLPKMTTQVVEFRHASWFREEIYALLNGQNAGFVIDDSSRFPAAEVVTGKVAYIRLHGPAQLYASSYTTEELQDWAKKIHEWLDRYTVHCYFNNDFGGRAIRNSIELRNFIEHI